MLEQVQQEGFFFFFFFSMELGSISLFIFVSVLQQGMGDCYVSEMWMSKDKQLCLCTIH